MSSYKDTLSADQLSNIYIIIDEMQKAGITNIYTQSAFLAVISKESAFYPQSETSYRNTSNDRIRKTFGSRVPSNDAELNALKQNDIKFFDTVYGGRYGNALNEGYKYRGRGFNQLTFKGNYASIGQRINIDIVSNPDLVNRIDVAAKVLIDYFLREFNNQKIDINSFKDSQTALKRVFEANRGFGKGSIDSVPDVTGGYNLALSRLKDFDLIVGLNKKKKITKYLIIILISIIVYLLLIKIFPSIKEYNYVSFIGVLLSVYFIYEKTSLKNINNLID